MPAETDDIEVFKRILEMAAKKYAETSSGKDRSMRFLDEVTAEFDEYIVRSNQGDAHALDLLPWWRRWTAKAIEAIVWLPYIVKYGTPPLRDRLTETFQSVLEQQRKVRPIERRTLNIHRVIRFSDDGACVAVLAPKKSYFKAMVALVAIGILIILAVALVWTTLSQFLMGIPICYALGYILGWLWRDAYESAWGRDRLARRLVRLFPFLKLQMT